MKKDTPAAKSAAIREKIVAFVQQKRRVGLRETARAVGLTTSPTFKHLQALVAAGTLTRDESRKYSLKV